MYTNLNTVEKMKSQNARNVRAVYQRSEIEYRRVHHAMFAKHNADIAELAEATTTSCRIFFGSLRWYCGTLSAVLQTLSEIFYGRERNSQWKIA